MKTTSYEQLDNLPEFDKIAAKLPKPAAALIDCIMLQDRHETDVPDRGIYGSSISTNLAYGETHDFVSVFVVTDYTASKTTAHLDWDRRDEKHKLLDSENDKYTLPFIPRKFEKTHATWAEEICAGYWSEILATAELA